MARTAHGTGPGPLWRVGPGRYEIRTCRDPACPELEIRPATNHIEMLARVDIEEVIGLGAKAARAALPKLRELFA